MKKVIIMILFILIIIILSISIFVYNQSYEDMSGDTILVSKDVAEFNISLLKYEGEQTGLQVKNLIDDLITNTNTYTTDYERLATIIIHKITATNSDGTIVRRPTDTDDVTSYIETLTTIKDKLEENHIYWIEFSNDSSIFKNFIEIYYYNPNLDNEENENIFKDYTLMTEMTDVTM